MRLIPYIAVGASLASAAPLSIIVSTTEVGSFRLGKAVHDVKTNVMVVPPSRMACNKMQGGVSKLFAMAGLGPAMPHDMAGFAKLGPEHHVAHLPGTKQFWEPAWPPHHLNWQHKGEQLAGVAEAETVNIPAEHVAHLPGTKQFWDPAWPPHHLNWQHKSEQLAGVAEAETVNIPAEQAHRGMHHMHHGGHFRHMHHRGSFIRRIHRALMSLGPWEGRAIAFVLGCGIGVLLRMLWVMFIVFKRVLSSEHNERSEDEVEYERVAVLLPLEMENEELFAAPPEYSADEKAPLPEDVKN